MRKVILLALALAILVGSSYLAWMQHTDVTVSTETIAGNPVNRYVANGVTPVGVVIVAHGMASNKQMMNPWGYYMARQGFDTYVLDEPGHGASTRRMPTWTAKGNTALGDNLRAMVDELVKEQRATPGRIALIGHSMGGFAVTQAALADTRLAATVAISNAYRDPIPAGQPRNLLSITAERDPGFMVQAAQALATASDAGKGVLGKQYGAFANGTARESDLVAGRNHITILYDPGAMQHAASWIAASLGTKPVAVSISWLWVLVALAGAIGVALSVGWIISPRQVPREARPNVRVGFLAALITLAVTALSAVVVTAYLRIPWLHIDITDYLLPYFLVAALVLLTLRWLWPKEFALPLVSGSWALDLVRSVGVFAAFVLAVGAVIQLNISQFIPTSPRILPLIVLAIGFWLYFIQEEGLKRAVCADAGHWAAFVVGLLGKVVIALTWLGSSALPNPEPMLALTVPGVLVLAIGLEAFGFVLTRWRYSGTAVAAFTSLVLAWVVATTFPLV
ncbi:MAG: alpha/beta hydrolase [Mycobacterium leprae]